MQTPPPTRDASSSRRSIRQKVGNNVPTPATVIARTPAPAQSSESLLNQTPFDFPSLQFSPELAQFPGTGPLSAPALPHSRLFWDQPNDNSMDVDMSMGLDPFGSTPHRMDESMGWQSFHSPATQVNTQAFQALHGMSSPGAGASFAHSNDGSFMATSRGVDPCMLFPFSSPGPSASFGFSVPQAIEQESRQPYETQLRDSQREREQARASSQHSRTNTSSSNASFDNGRPGLQRSATDSGFRKSRPSSVESKQSNSATGFNLPRRSSPLKRQSNGSLTSIPEIRRPRTRLVIDENGRARTETEPVDDNTASRVQHTDLRRQYPGLWTEEDSDSEDEEPPVTLSRNPSFNVPARRSTKHARNDSGDLERSNSFKMSRPSSGIFDKSFDKSSFETIRPVKKLADNAFRRFSMMDFSTSFNDNKDEEMPDSPGDALGALKKVVEGRQKRIGMAIAVMYGLSADVYRTFNSKYPQSAQSALGTSFCRYQLQQHAQWPLRPL